MSDDNQPKRKRGRPRGKGTEPRITFTLPQDHFDFLRLLVRVKKRFGKSEHEAAKYIVQKELDELFRADFHKKEIE